MAGESQLEAMYGALYTRLSGDATLTTLATGGIYTGRAPSGAVAPYVVIRKRPGGGYIAALGEERAMNIVVVEITAFVPGVATSAAQRIDERIRALCADHVLSVVSPYVASPMRRLADIDEHPIVNGVEFDRVGGMYRIPLSGG